MYQDHDKLDKLHEVTEEAPIKSVSSKTLYDFVSIISENQTCALGDVNEILRFLSNDTVPPEDYNPTCFTEDVERIAERMKVLSSKISRIGEVLGIKS